MQRKQNNLVLPQGAQRKIAEALSCSPETVKSVIIGRRSGETALGKKIMDAIAVYQSVASEVEFKLEEVARA